MTEHTNTPPAGELYACDLTIADVENALAFLLPQLEAEAYGKGNTPSSRIARGMIHLVRGIASETRVYLQKFGNDDFFSGSDRTRSEFALRDAWNRLIDTLDPWQTDEDYDTARWRRTYYFDAQAETAEGEMLREAAALRGTGQTSKE
jgi:hypothetical protein